VVDATLGTPFVVKVVCNTVVEVVEYAIVKPVTLVVVVVIVLSDVSMCVDPLPETGTSNVVDSVVVKVVGTGMFVEVDTTMMVSSVVTGTVTVWVIVPSDGDVALLNGAVVCKGCKVEEEPLGILVGKG
jgi:hypothetical protein